MKHVANFFVEGLYSKGPGNSFALPTHEPIMILRDPPGGDSYATYESVQTTVRVVEAETSVKLSFASEGKIGASADGEVNFCAGE